MDSITSLHARPKAWLANSVLAPHVVAFASYLTHARYSAQSRGTYVASLAHLARWIRPWVSTDGPEALDSMVMDARDRTANLAIFAAAAVVFPTPPEPQQTMILVLRSSMSRSMSSLGGLMLMRPPAP